MKVSIETNAFITALKKAHSCAASKAACPIIENVKVDFDEDMCRITGYNLDQYVIAKVKTEFPVESNFSFILSDVKQILKAAKYFFDTFLVINFENNKISVECGNKKFEKVIAYKVKDYPELFDIKQDREYQYDAKSLVKRYNLIKYAVGKNTTQKALEFINFTECDMVACDGFRLSKNTDDNLSVEKPFSIYAESMKLVSSLIDKKVTVRTGSKGVIFEGEDVEIGCHILDGEYLNYNKIANVSEYNTNYINAEKFLGEMKYINEFIEKENRYTVGLYQNTLKTISSSGRYETKVDVKGDEIGYPVFFDGRFMADALGQFEGKIDLMTKGKYNAIILQDENGNMALVMPIREREDYFVEVAAS